MSKQKSFSAVLRSAVISAVCLIGSGSAQAGYFDNIYVLGDSLSDQGNLFTVTSAVAGVGLPSAPPYFNGRFSNGAVYTDYLAQSLGLSLTPSIAGGNNFAYGGARTNGNSVEDVLPAGLFPWSLNGQIQAFSSRGVADSRGLYIVFSGSNDVADMVKQVAAAATLAAISSGGDPNAIQAATLAAIAATNSNSLAAVQAIGAAVAAFKAAGAQYVLVPNLPDLGKVPLSTAQNPPGSTFVSDVAGLLAQRFNAELAAMLDQISGVKIVQFDTFGLLDQVIANPGAFGVSNVTTPCYTGFVAPPSSSDTVCADPQNYVFWDAEHPTTGIQAILADRFLAAVDNVVPEPGSLSLLAVAGLFWGGWQRRRSGVATA